MGTFEKYMVNTLEKISENKPINWDLWFLRMQVYLKLIQAGMKPATAQKVMNVYMVVN